MRRSNIVYILVLLCVIALLIGISLPTLFPEIATLRFSGQVMGTYYRLVMLAPDNSVSHAVAAVASTEMSSIEYLASTYRPESEVSQLAVLQPDTPRVLSPEIFSVLQRSLYYYQLTNGAFDVTVGPLMKLWRDAVKRDIPPTPEQITTALQSVGSDKIILDPATRSIILTHPGMSITLDAIVKGYAADQALDEIRNGTASAGLVDIGGDIVCFGCPPGQNAWRIGIQNPFQPATGPMNTSAGSLLATIALTDAAVATSGNYQRTFQIQGKSYSQIIDPRTGYPVEQAPSVTIIAPTAADADALATACSVLTVPEALDLINSIPATEALFITGSPDAPVFRTSAGFKDYLLTPLPDY